MLHRRYIAELYAREQGIRPVTRQEAEDRFLDTVAGIATYWSKQREDPYEACHGTAFSILNVLDGTNCGHPAVDLVITPHPDDYAYSVDEGLDYEPEPELPGFNAMTMLHERYHDFERKHPK